MYKSTAHTLIPRDCVRRTCPARQRSSSRHYATSSAPKHAFQLVVHLLHILHLGAWGCERQWQNCKESRPNKLLWQTCQESRPIRPPMQSSNKVSAQKGFVCWSHIWGASLALTPGLVAHHLDPSSALLLNNFTLFLFLGTPWQTAQQMHLQSSAAKTCSLTLLTHSLLYISHALLTVFLTVWLSESLSLSLILPHSVLASSQQSSL
jgi:hypothetical protein